MSKVAVVIATYNTARHVGEAVESVLEQTMEDLELVVVDDGSTDDTASVVERYLADPRIRWVRQDNRGQASAKNRGIAESSAPIVGFCDADDFWEPDKLALQLPLFNDARVGVVYSDMRRFMDGPTGRHEIAYKREQRHSGRVTDALFIENFVPFGSALVRRECLARCGTFDESLKMGIDWDLWLRISLDWEFRFVDEATYNYRVWDQQMSQNWRGRYEHAVAIMEHFLSRHPRAVAPGIVRRAWAHTFANRGRTRVAMDGEYIAGLRDVVRAIRTDPGYGGSWRIAAWIVLTAMRATAGRGRAVRPG